jgi:hypothetical protein
VGEQLVARWPDRCRRRAHHGGDRFDAVMQLGVVVEQRRPIQQARSTSTSVTWISTSITEGGNPVLSATFGAASATHQRSGGDSRLSLPPEAVA